jgi:hypothetical protein
VATRPQHSPAFSVHPLRTVVHGTRCSPAGHLLLDLLPDLLFPFGFPFVFVAASPERHPNFS